MDNNIVKQLTDVGDLDNLAVFTSENLQPLDPLVLSFTSTLAKKLLTPTNQSFPELVALGFWLREANLTNTFAPQFSQLRKPLGVIIHYTPSNVDTMFVYSWICSLVSGNRNLVRLNSVLSELQQTLLANIGDILGQPEFEAVAKANQFIQYEKTSEVLAEKLSLHADARILWGGDASVSAIRALPIKPRCRDISFSDRFSACIIDGDKLTSGNLQDVAECLYRDIHPFDQQACSSPKLLFWKGNSTLQLSFLGSLDERFKNDFSITLKNEQLVMSQSMAAMGKVEQALLQKRSLILHMKSGQKLDLTLHNGQFAIWLLNIDEVEELSFYCDAKMQTLCYWGVEKEELIKFLANPSINGIDRLVPLGRALSFSPQWDGYDLVDQLTRIISFE